MRFILKVKDRGFEKYPRFIYTVEDDDGNIYTTRKSQRKYVACTLYETSSGYEARNYYGRLDLVDSGWSKYDFDWLKRNNMTYTVVYTKQGIEQLVKQIYDRDGIQAALLAADKHGTVVSKYCSGCDNYYPAFKDEDFCLICGGAHTKRKDPDLLIPLENKE